jgi:hypothetical protein
MTENETKMISNRNNIDMDLSKSKINKNSKTRAGFEFYYPELRVLPVLNDKGEQVKDAEGEDVVQLDPVGLQWFGAQTIADFVNDSSRRSAMDTVIEMLEKTTDGILNLEEFLTEVTNFTARREKLADIEDRIAVLVDENVRLIDLPNCFDDTEEGHKIQAAMRSNKDNIKILTEKRAALEAKNAAKAAKLKATKAAKKLSQKIPTVVAA